MAGRAALAHELSCRWVTPLLDLVEAEGRTAGLDTLLRRWEVTRADLRDQSNWVSLRFCEDLIDWLGAEIGADKLADEIARAMYSPRALGVMYPVFRAFGSPRVGYGALPQLIPRLNKVSAVSVARVRRGAAELTYRPAAPEHKERSPLICRMRKAQVAAGPTLWNLPPARVEESECQVRGGEACRYSIRWGEAASIRGLLLGLLAGGAIALAQVHGVWAALVALCAGGALGRIVDLRAHGRELQAFVGEHTLALTAALDTTELRFVELQKAKAEVDARVEQRTAELRTAT